MLVMLLVSASPALADESLGWRKGDVVLRAAATGILFDSSSIVKLGGNVVPGGSVKLSNGVTMTGELEYFPVRSLSVTAVVGIPLETTGTGTGTLAPLGRAGSIKYGIGGLLARYHINASGRFSPFVSFGVSRLLVFSEKDGSVTDLQVDGAWGPSFQGGADFHVSRNVGIYVNASFIPMKTNARGMRGALPVDARATVNPTTIKAGLSYRF